MAAIHQQGSDLRLDTGDIGPESGLPGSDISTETGVYISPPLVGEGTDYPGGIADLSGAAAEAGTSSPASDEPFGEELAGNNGEALGEAGGWQSTVAEVGRKIDTRLRHELQEHPYRSLAAAAAVGYMLHSGVTSKSGRLVLLLGGRYALQAFASSMSGEED